MAADARLRQLQHGAQLRDRQLVLLEQEQDPAARRVGQRRHVVQDRDHISVYPDGMLHTEWPCVQRNRQRWSRRAAGGGSDPDAGGL